MCKDFIKFLKKFEQRLYGCNYEVHFYIQSTNCINSLQDIIKSIKVIFPESNPADNKLCIITPSIMVEDINSKLFFRNNKSEGYYLDLSVKDEIDFKMNYFDKFWNYIISEIDLINCDIYTYMDFDELPLDYVFWGFRYFLLNKKNNMLYYLSGISSD